MASKYNQLRLKNQLCFPIYLCSKEIVRRYDKVLKRINLTYTQYIIMMYFWETKKSNVKKISNALLLDSSTISPILKKLEKKGFLLREKSNADERNLIVSITNKGMKLQDDAFFVSKEMEKCIKLSENDIKSMYTIINQILMNLEDFSNE